MRGWPPEPGPRQVEANHDVIDDVGEGPVGVVISAIEPLAGQGKPARNQGQDTAVAEPADDGGGPAGSQDQARCLGEAEMRTKREPTGRDDGCRQGRDDDR